MALIDCLQAVPGVKVADFIGAWYTEPGRTRQPISGKVRPYAGYFNLNNISLTLEAYA